nr:hypothetical protein [Synechococcus sp. CBW1107]
MTGLDFEDHAEVWPAELLQHGVKFFHITRLLDEREAHDVGMVRDEGQHRPVALCQGGQGQGGVRKIDALISTEAAASAPRIGDLHQQAFSVRRNDHSSDASVIKRDPLSRLHLAEHPWKGASDLCRLEYVSLCINHGRPAVIAGIGQSQVVARSQQETSILGGKGIDPQLQAGLLHQKAQTRSEMPVMSRRGPEAFRTESPHPQSALSP